MAIFKGNIRESHLYEDLHVKAIELVKFLYGFKFVFWLT